MRLVIRSTVLCGSSPQHIATYTPPTDASDNSGTQHLVDNQPTRTGRGHTQDADAQMARALTAAHDTADASARGWDTPQQSSNAPDAQSVPPTAQCTTVKDAACTTPADDHVCPRCCCGAASNRRGVKNNTAHSIPGDNLRMQGISQPQTTKKPRSNGQKHAGYCWQLHAHRASAKARRTHIHKHVLTSSQQLVSMCLCMQRLLLRTI